MSSEADIRGFKTALCSNSGGRELVELAPTDHAVVDISTQRFSSPAAQDKGR